MHSKKCLFQITMIINHCSFRFFWASKRNEKPSVNAEELDNIFINEIKQTIYLITNFCVTPSLFFKKYTPGDKDDTSSVLTA